MKILLLFIFIPIYVNSQLPMEFLNLKPLYIQGSLKVQYNNMVNGWYSWTVPANVYQVYFDVCGAQGAGNSGDPLLGGNGSRITGYLNVTPNSIIYIQVGITGKYTGGSGGINSAYSTRYGGAGGDATIVSNSNNLNSLDVLMVAGGGGGASGFIQSGYAGYYGGNGGEMGFNGQSWAFGTNPYANTDSSAGWGATKYKNGFRGISSYIFSDHNYNTREGVLVDSALSGGYHSNLNTTNSVYFRDILSYNQLFGGDGGVAVNGTLMGGGGGGGGYFGGGGGGAGNGSHTAYNEVYAGITTYYYDGVGAGGGGSSYVNPLLCSLVTFVNGYNASVTGGVANFYW